MSIFLPNWFTQTSGAMLLASLVLPDFLDLTLLIVSQIIFGYLDYIFATKYPNQMRRIQLSKLLLLNDTLSLQFVLPPGFSVIFQNTPQLSISH